MIHYSCSQQVHELWTHSISSSSMYVVFIADKSNNIVQCCPLVFTPCAQGSPVSGATTAFLNFPFCAAFFFLFAPLQPSSFPSPFPFFFALLALSSTCLAFSSFLKDFSIFLFLFPHFPIFSSCSCFFFSSCYCTW